MPSLKVKWQRPNVRLYLKGANVTRMTEKLRLQTRAVILISEIN